MLRSALLRQLAATQAVTVELRRALDECHRRGPVGRPGAGPRGPSREEIFQALRNAATLSNILGGGRIFTDAPKGQKGGGGRGGIGGAGF